MCAEPFYGLAEACSLLLGRGASDRFRVNFAKRKKERQRERERERERGRGGMSSLSQRNVGEEMQGAFRVNCNACNESRNASASNLLSLSLFYAR